MRICKSSSARVLDADFRDISFPSQGCMGRMCVENAQNWLKDEEIPHDTAVYICKPEDRVTDQNKLTLVNADISELPPLPNFPGHPIPAAPFIFPKRPTGQG